MGKLIAFSLTLIRHGETTANKDNIIQGQSDTPLSEAGRRQARLVGSRLQNDRLTHVYASDLIRAAQTAQVIVEANKVYSCTVVKDKRLRERKYGTMEGKSFRELAAEAKKKNVTITNYTPFGAEPIDQVRKRAQSFFQDLIDLLKNSTTDEADYVPASIKCRADRSLNSTSSPGKDSMSSETSHNVNNVNITNRTIIPEVSDKIENASKRPRHDDVECFGSSPHGVFPMELSKSYTDRFVHDRIVENNQQQSMPQIADAQSNSNNVSDVPNKLKTFQSLEHTDLSTGKCLNDLNAREANMNSQVIDTESKVDRLPVRSVCTGCPNVSLSPLSFPEFEHQTEELSTPTDDGSTNSVSEELPLTSPVIRDSEIKTVIRSSRTANLGCPNVSLSPLMEHRLSSISSISSGRNSSFDDTDGVPSTVADVLIVSHGGLLKELIRHFVEDFHCKVPGGKGHAFRVGPNASLSKFTVTIDEITELPVITCLKVHDKDHLLPVESDDFQENL